MNKRVALYVRVSTDAQSEKLIAFCQMKGLKDYELFVDGCYSGSNLNRPGIQKLITEINNKNISHVVVFKLDRLSRSQKDTLNLIEDVFLPNETDFVSIHENFDTSSPYGRAMIGIISAFAQLERENIFCVPAWVWLSRSRTACGWAVAEYRLVTITTKSREYLFQAVAAIYQGRRFQNIRLSLNPGRQHQAAVLSYPS